MMRGTKTRHAISWAQLAIALGVAAIATGGAGACAPEDRTFEPGTGGGGGSGGGGACTPDTERPCYSGPPGTEDVGLCKAGIQVCLASGTVFGECGGEVVPKTEDCLTPEDEACDGSDTMECLPLGDGWFKTYGEIFSPQNIDDIAVTPDGNFIIVGAFGGMIDLGSGPMASTGSHDILVAKIDPLGKPIWAKRFGDASSQRAFAVAVGPAGAIYVGGSVSGSVDFGDGIKTSKGGSDAFLAEFDANGDVVWSKLFGDTASQIIRSLAVTKANQIIAGGGFAGTVSFNDGATTLTAAGSNDVFVAKFDESGFHAASRRFGGQTFEDLRGLAVAETGEVFITGTFDGTFDAQVPALVSKGGRDIFVARLSPTTLAPQWARGWGDPADQEAFDVAVATNGDLFLSGAFEGLIDFGGQTVTSPAAGAHVLYVTRMSASADQIFWAKPFGDGTAFVNAGQLAFDAAADQLVIAGSFSGGIDFGGGVRTSVDNFDPILAKLSGDGAHIASRVLPSTPGVNDAGNVPLAIALLPSGDLIVSGNHRTPFEINKQAVGNTDPKDGDAFLGRFLH
jgi:hypothetical protein